MKRLIPQLRTVDNNNNNNSPFKGGHSIQSIRFGEQWEGWNHLSFSVLQKVIAVTVVVVRTAATTRMFPNYYCPLPIDDYFDATKNNEVISQPISVPISKVPILDYIHDEEIFCNVFSWVNGMNKQQQHKGVRSLLLQATCCW